MRLIFLLFLGLFGIRLKSPKPERILIKSHMGEWQALVCRGNRVIRIAARFEMSGITPVPAYTKDLFRRMWLITPELTGYYDRKAYAKKKCEIENMEPSKETLKSIEIAKNAEREIRGGKTQNQIIYGN